MKITDMILSALLRKGILWESTNVEMTTEIPDTKIKVSIKIDHMTVTFIEDEKEA